MIKKTASEDILNNFLNPPAVMRSAPFRAWNGKLPENILKEQIKNMHEMDFSRFFLYPRTGLYTDCLSNEWGKSTDTCISEMPPEHYALKKNDRKKPVRTNAKFMNHYQDSSFPADYLNQL